MVYLSLFLGSTLAFLGMALIVQNIEKIKGKDALGLFGIGALMSLPFILVEQFHLSILYVIVAFVGIEALALYLEEHVKGFHDLMHHNIRNLRVVSFLLVGIGFTYGEITTFMIHNAAHLEEAMNLLPLKAMYALFMHTVLSTASSLISLGNFVAHDLIETVIRFVSYYAKVALVAVSHFVYMLFTEHMTSWLMIPFLLINLMLFLHYKHVIDRKALALQEEE